LHVWPVAVQSLQLPPKVPQVALLDFMHDPPWQQPLRHVSKLQLPPPPLDEPLEEPEELPLDPPDELLVTSAQDPLWHVWLMDVQSLQVAPWTPQDESSMPELQLPFASQHPVQVVEQALAPPLSSPDTVVLPLDDDDDDASSLDPVVSSPGVFRPGPMLVAIGAASMAPESCVATGVVWTESWPSPYVAVDPVAHATRTTRAHQPKRIVRWSVEAMRWTSRLAVTSALNQRAHWHQARRAGGVDNCVHAVSLHRHRPKIARSRASSRPFRGACRSRACPRRCPPRSERRKPRP
jgi:hypothetical protein